MKRIFSRHYLAAHAPSFAMQLDQDDEFSIKFNTREEKSMLMFLKSQGFDMKRINKYGFGFSVLDNGNVSIESK